MQIVTQLYAQLLVDGHIKDVVALKGSLEKVQNAVFKAGISRHDYLRIGNNRNFERAETFCSFEDTLSSNGGCDRAVSADKQAWHTFSDSKPVCVQNE